MKPNALLITRNLPPLIGGMERLNWHLAHELSQHYNLTVVAPKRAKSLMPTTINFFGAELNPLWKFLLTSLYICLRTVKKIKPEIVIAGSGLTAPAAFLSAKISGAKSVAYLHGLDVSVNNRIYRWLWLPIIKRMDLLIANSTPTANLIRQLGVSDKRIRIIHPGVSRPAAPLNDKEIEEFKERNGIEGKTVLLSVGRLTQRKGLLDFITCSLPKIVKQYPNTILLIVGNSPNNALYAKEVTSLSLIEAAGKNNVANHVKFIGNVDDKALSQAMYASAVHVFPVKEIQGDPEGFGMVAIEAAMHGLPTVAFSVGGVADAVNNGISGYLVEQKKYDLFSDRILSILNEPTSLEKATCIAFAHQFEWSKFGEKLKLALSEIE